MKNNKLIEYFQKHYGVNIVNFFDDFLIKFSGTLHGFHIKFLKKIKIKDKDIELNKSSGFIFK